MHLQEVPLELREMAERFERMKVKRAAERFGGGGGRRYGQRSQRGGRDRMNGCRSSERFHF